jgi:hypothetical protein
MVSKKKKSARQRSVDLSRHLQVRILLAMMLLWLAALWVFGAGIDPNFL